jgi:hypothetical protein
VLAPVTTVTPEVVTLDTSAVFVTTFEAATSVLEETSVIVIAVPRVTLLAATSLAATFEAVTSEPVASSLAVQLNDRTPLATDAVQEATVP